MILGGLSRFGVIVSVALLGCGQAPVQVAVSNNSAPFAQQAQVADPYGHIAQLIKSQLEEQTAASTVTLTQVQVIPTPIIGLYKFTAVKSISGMSVSSRLVISGTYSTRTQVVRVSQTIPQD